MSRDRGPLEQLVLDVIAAHDVRGAACSCVIPDGEYGFTFHEDGYEDTHLARVIAEAVAARPLYLAVHGMGYEGEHPVGLFATLEDAQMVAEAHVLQHDSDAQDRAELWEADTDPIGDPAGRWEASCGYSDAIVVAWTPRSA